MTSGIQVVARSPTSKGSPGDHAAVHVRLAMGTSSVPVDRRTPGSEDPRYNRLKSPEVDEGDEPGGR